MDSTSNLKSDSDNTSINSDKKSKYVFGKYLKLDEDAMKHFEFLKNIEQKSLFKNNNKDKIISRWLFFATFSFIKFYLLLFLMIFFFISKIFLLLTFYALNYLKKFDIKGLKIRLKKATNNKWRNIIFLMLKP